jgi:hypothetical protein
MQIVDANLTCAFWDFFRPFLGGNRPVKPLFYSIVISKMAIIVTNSSRTGSCSFSIKSHI